MKRSVDQILEEDRQMMEDSMGKRAGDELPEEDYDLVEVEDMDGYDSLWKKVKSNSAWSSAQWPSADHLFAPANAVWPWAVWPSDLASGLSPWDDRHSDRGNAQLLLVV